uniref:Uncharacterized protein n=1 Tax=Timema monikensis TaxID=170555 RepID=A0A7R9EFB2_9NEOP|nr:unnamed protein product [Timema monikensis]
MKKLGDSVAGGFLSVMCFFYNHNEMLKVAWCTWTVLVTWQFSQFVLATQLVVLVFMFTLNLIDKLTLLVIVFGQISHVIYIILSKLSKYKDFHTLLYTCAPEFDFLPMEMVHKLGETFLLPAAGVAILTVMATWLYRFLVNYLEKSGKSHQLDHEMITLFSLVYKCKKFEERLTRRMCNCINAKNFTPEWIGGLKDRRHLSQKIGFYKKSVLHTQSSKVRSAWIRTATIDRNSEKQIGEESVYWREVLVWLIKTILFLTDGNMAAMCGKEGKRKGDRDPLEGNFLGTVKLVAEFYPILGKQAVVH